ncbi:MAG: XRE family transcriptional regulator [bacterium]|nr:XRE family transcriptional regulator [bacterium]
MQQPITEDESDAVVRGSDNVFEDLGFNTEEAASLKVRTDLMLGLRKYIQDQGWGTPQAARFFGVNAATINDLIDGEPGRFTVDGLISMLARANMRFRVEILPQAA